MLLTSGRALKRSAWFRQRNARYTIYPSAARSWLLKDFSDHTPNATHRPPKSPGCSDQALEHPRLIENVTHIVQTAVQITPDVVTKDVGDLGVFAVHRTCRMGADKHVRHVPQGTFRRKRLDLEYVQTGEGDLPRPKRSEVEGPRWNYPAPWSTT